jgi:hypothetical protein
MGTLYYGECLHTATFDILRRYVKDETVDLDPPFKCAANYNKTKTETPTT